MNKRFEIEITSQLSEDAWTWRVVGARLPKGKIDASLLPDSVQVGTVLRAEAESSLDGIDILRTFELEPPSEPTNRIELLNTRTQFAVTTQLAPKRGKQKRHARTQNADNKGSKRTPNAHTASGSTAQLSNAQDARKPETRNRKELKGKNKKQRQSQKFQQNERTHERHKHEQSGLTQNRNDASSTQSSNQLRPKKVHRQALMGCLTEEQKPLAHELAQGGIPHLRKLLERLDERAKAENLPQVASVKLLDLAEDFLPYIQTATWRDRAEAALESIEHVDLSEIRSIVVASDSSARTEETRVLADQIKSALTARVEFDHNKWLANLATNISENRAVRALRLSSQPPKAGAPLPVDIAERLIALASAELNEEISAHRWLVLVEALVYSPVRMHVQPAGKPKKPNDALLYKINKIAHKVPHIASMFESDSDIKSDCDAPQ